LALPTSSQALRFVFRTDESITKEVHLKIWNTLLKSSVQRRPSHGLEFWLFDAEAMAGWSLSFMPVTPRTYRQTWCARQQENWLAADGRTTEFLAAA